MILKLLVAKGAILISRTTVFYDFDALPTDAGRSEMRVGSPRLVAAQSDGAPDREASAP
jgi:hypothetical protein